MSDRDLYTGYAINGIDAKGRVAIPAFLRTTIERNSDGRFVTISNTPGEQCLQAYDRDWTRHLREQIRSDENNDRAGGKTFDRKSALRRGFALSEEVPYDSSGRFILPGFMRETASLTDTALFFGIGDTFEIWSPKVLLAAPDLDDEIKQVATWLIKQRGAA